MIKKCLKYGIFTSLIVLKEIIITASADFKTFMEWWDKTKKPEVAEKAKTSILQKLRQSQAIFDKRKEQQCSNLNRNNLSPER